ncbi:RDD family protein [Segetibacter sp. 3557_3]|uniref:RDD family protein n=1 Tax=Segetibacter sp. 3557_3 TaxID=2547429 RepID=UPI0010583C07|nr:RDD family protein [Segetibacter sp. 3557_3]TDH28764.1 RDD family protein [Segetibacter sp. 3557_3]
MQQFEYICKPVGTAVKITDNSHAFSNNKILIAAVTMSSINVITSQNIEIEYELASLGDRILGYIIDWLIIFAYIILIVVVFRISTGLDFFGEQLWLPLLLGVPVLCYDLLSELFFNGQSAGKKAMGIKVISLTGERPTFGQYLIRWLFRLVDFTISSHLVGLIMVAATERKQRLGDMVAGTTLIKTTPRTQLEDTMYVSGTPADYEVIYPEVVNLKDADLELVKEVIVAVRRSGNTTLALQAQQKIEQLLHIRSRQHEPLFFLQTILTDYQHITSKL